MSSAKDYWRQACNSLKSLPVSELQRSSLIANGIAVSVFALAAVVSGVVWALQRRLLLWRRRGWDVVGDKTWKNLGRFGGWMCCGCFAGVVAFAAYMQTRQMFFESEKQLDGTRENYALLALAVRYACVFYAFKPLELLCVIYAMNLLLRRVSDHASHSYYNEARDFSRARRTGVKRFDWRDCVGQYALYYWVRSHHVVSIVLCVLHAVAGLVSAALYAENAAFLDAAAGAAGENATAASIIILMETYSPIQQRSVNSTVAVNVLEVSVLVFTVSAFLLFFPACIVLFRRVERKLDSIMKEMDHRPDYVHVFLPFEFSPAEADGTRSQTQMLAGDARLFLSSMKSAAVSQRLKFISCLFLVLFALCVRTSLALFNVVVGTNFKPQPGCMDTCGTCQSLEYLMYQWYIRQNALVPLVISLSSTLPLVFSLWLMTTREDRHLMCHPSEFRTTSATQQPESSAIDCMLEANSARMGIQMQ